MRRLTSRLSHYEILSSIGIGGIGEVYWSRDSELNGNVAIKVIPEIFAQDSDRLARFQLNTPSETDDPSTMIVVLNWMATLKWL